MHQADVAIRTPLRGELRVRIPFPPAVSLRTFVPEQMQPLATWSDRYRNSASSSRMTHRRIEEKIGVRYEDFSRIPELVDRLKAAMGSHPDIDAHLPILIVLNGFNEFTLDLYIDVYTLETRYEKYLMVKHEILMLIYKEMMEAGAEMPIPMLAIQGRLETEAPV